MLKISKITFLAMIVAITSSLAACSPVPEESVTPKVKVPVQDQSEQDQDGQTSEPEEPNSENNSEEGQSPTITEASTEVIKALKAEDLQTVSSWVSNQGVRFSPYANINPEHDLVFSADEVAKLMQDTTKYVWRSTPGNEDKIELTYADYHQQYVYNKDFITAGENAVNANIATSSDPSNLYEVYPQANHDFVEFHVKGTAADGRDWSTLRLVFEKIGEEHTLVGIVHDQWTP
ncbi:hypothetical protein [Paenibacillus sp. QZ-Y1]|uniref:hypothetical protein n=1 Tax=Paenibacillus sp. QZ-Y1 TaxID=3414511 RepID=UPI003F7A5149